MPYMVDRDGIAMGPYSREDLEQKVAQGVLELTDRACDQTGGTWLPISKLLAGHTGDLAVITSGKKINFSTILAPILAPIKRALPRRSSK
jgi:hypothetical protein